jgi:hypothetical protein
MRRKPSCFVSYSHDDIDRDVLDYFAYLISENSNDAYEVLLDTDLPYGEDFQDFMDRLSSDEVIAVIILLTPSYKQKVLERRGGVYEEYRRIMHRYSQLQEEKRQGKMNGEIQGYFKLFPILFSGTFDTSIPEELATIKTLNMVGLRVTRNRKGEFQIPPYVARKYIPEILKIVGSLQHVTTVKSRDFISLYDQYFKRLFLELKADWTHPRDQELTYLETLFVKTFAYKKVESQAVYFMIGRKGSGKTTIADAMALRKVPRHLAHIPIIADEFNLEIPYYILSGVKIRSDMHTTFPRHKCFMFAWEAFLYLCCINAIVEVNRAGQLTPYQTSFIDPLAKFCERVCGDLANGAQNILSAHFIYCFSAITRFLEDCIEKARSDDEFFFADLQRLFQRDRFLSFVFPKDVLDGFLSILATLRRRFLITLDGFDTAFDLFRRKSLQQREDLHQKAEFEIDWLRAFLHVVLLLKEGGKKAGLLGEAVEFCITVPQDRFIEVLESERDSYRYHSRYYELKWSGIELAILLRKRLEALAQTSTDKQKRPEERLEEIMQRSFRHIPSTITFDFNQRRYTMPLFMYVLRHTFWRPRDVLLYYAQIIAVAESLRRKGHELSIETIRHTISDATRSVIKTEFINEFDSTIINIEEILLSFRGAKQVLTYNDVVTRIGKIDFSFAVGSREKIDLDDKIRLLYRIGFLGVLADENLRNRLNLKSPHAFYFNEGDTPMRWVEHAAMQEYKFLVHPVFSEYLELDTSENELILQFSWTYLHETEALLFA